VADRAILVGDAGGYLDPITGEGISLALQGAHWAAEVVADALRRDDLSAARLRPYHTRVEKALGHSRILTRAVLGLVRDERLAAFVVRRLACCPELYSSLLAISCGVRTFWDLRLADLLGLVFRRPRRGVFPSVSRSAGGGFSGKVAPDSRPGDDQESREYP
jgi:flavin-dependent dehydrogenase